MCLANLGRAAGPPQPPCRAERTPLNPPHASEPAMSAIYTILIFLVVFAALNRYEFGRFD
ncbi:MAG: hypothetical protein IT546_07045 [Caulobacteraceae bacterium]|nr:hypothetical protein [Caulobacteraceae bacterium]